MIIPTQDLERFAFYTDISESCSRSRQDRISEYISRESYYLFGSGSGSPPAGYNKIYPNIQTLASFLYASELTSYTLEMSASARMEDVKRIPVISRVINSTWLNSDSDAVANQCVEWSLVYNTMIMKTLWSAGEFRSYAVRPHDFAVYEEDKVSIDDQEALVHFWYMTRPSLERILEGNPRKKTILDGLVTSKKDADNPSGLDRLLLTASSPNITADMRNDNPYGNYVSGISNISGSLASSSMDQAASYDAVPGVEMIEMREMWVWNDKADDYQVVTQAGAMTIFDRLAGELTKQGQMFPKGENPFTKICPTPKFNYFWGISDVGRVQGLQDRYSVRMSELDNLLAKQVNPPTFSTGLTAEQAAALSYIGGNVNASDPTASLKPLPPDIPPQLTDSITMIEEQFAESLALHNILQGRGETGVRSRGHAQELAKLSSSRIKRKALNIEDSLEKSGTLMLSILKLNNAERLPDVDGGSFLLENFTSDCVVKVDAHSNSPLFADDTRSAAMDLLEHKIIDGESYIDMIKPPMADLLKMRFREAQQKAEDAQKQADQAQQQAAQAQQQPQQQAPQGGQQ